MTSKFQIVRGSGNVFRDFDHIDADIEQAKSVLASEIIKQIDRRGLTVREAEAATGFAAADFSRIRQARLDRFTIDRLMMILGRFDRTVRVTVLPRRHAA